MLAVVPVAVGCGQSAATTSSHAAPHEASAATARDASRDVLQLGDLGDGWVIDFWRSGKFSLQESMKGDSAATRDIEQRAYRSGYRAVFDGSAGYGIYSFATTYATARAARQIAVGWARTTPAHMVKPARIDLPGASLGDQLNVWKATATARGGAIPTYFAQWVRGNVIAGVATYGRGATVADLTRLANLQDARLSGTPVPIAPVVGEEAKSATQILRDATAAVDAARSVHLVENTPGQGLDFHAGRQVGTGTIRTNFGVMRSRRVGQHIWVEGNRGYYLHVANPAAAARVAGRWLPISPTNPGYVGVANLTNTQFVARMMAPATNGEAPRKAGSALIHGTLVILIEMNSAGGTRTAVYIRAHGTPYPLQVDQADQPGKVGRVILSSWNQPISVRPPAHPLDPATIPGAGCPCT